MNRKKLNKLKVIDKFLMVSLPIIIIFIELMPDGFFKKNRLILSLVIIINVVLFWISHTTIKKAEKLDT